MTDELVKVDGGEPVPLWALDMAAKAGQSDAYDNWQGANNYLSSSPMRRSIIAHARTLAENPERYKPVDPAEEQRWKDAREAAGINDGVTAPWAKDALTGMHDDDCCICSAYIALCNRDGVTPNLGEKK